MSTTSKLNAKAVFVTIILTAVACFAEDIYSYGKNLVIPPRDQMSEIQQSIDELVDVIDGNSDAIEKFSNQISQNQKVDQELIAEIVEKLRKIIENSQSLTKETRKLKKVTNVVKENEGAIYANVEYWLPLNLAIKLDNINSFGFFYNNGLQSSLNGQHRSFVAGDRAEYTGENGNKCYINYMGKQGDLYGMSFHCEK